MYKLFSTIPISLLKVENDKYTFFEVVRESLSLAMCSVDLPQKSTISGHVKIDRYDEQMQQLNFPTCFHLDKAWCVNRNSVESGKYSTYSR